mmetsp:Transcript_18498/g.70159  ORF Transcript_18498/g.70159 Transcript_18498/m.70159 type:complete len:228 (-) Transcript_18498:836-1519(-)
MRAATRKGPTPRQQTITCGLDQAGTRKNTAWAASQPAAPWLPGQASALRLMTERRGASSGWEAPTSPGTTPRNAPPAPNSAAPEGSWEPTPMAVTAGHADRMPYTDAAVSAERTSGPLTHVRVPEVAAAQQYSAESASAAAMGTQARMPLAIVRGQTAAQASGSKSENGTTSMGAEATDTTTRTTEISGHTRASAAATLAHSALIAGKSVSMDQCEANPTISRTIRT